MASIIVTITIIVMIAIIIMVLFADLPRASQPRPASGRRICGPSSLPVEIYGFPMPLFQTHCFSSNLFSNQGCTRTRFPTRFVSLGCSFVLGCVRPLRGIATPRTPRVPTLESELGEDPLPNRYFIVGMRGAQQPLAKAEPNREQSST